MLPERNQEFIKASVAVVTPHNEVLAFCRPLQANLQNRMLWSVSVVALIANNHCLSLPQHGHGSPSAVSFCNRLMMLLTPYRAYAFSR